jgi:hypothetical protein
MVDAWYFLLQRQTISAIDRNINGQGDFSKGYFLSYSFS